jgi:endo-1,4-beta-xylanase
MVQISILLTALAAVSGVSASLARARRALEERQSSNSPPNAIQNWKNDYATVDFKTGSNGLFSVDWNNGLGGNFVVGRGWNPARDMSVFSSHHPRSA